MLSVPAWAVAATIFFCPVSNPSDCMRYPIKVDRKECNHAPIRAFDASKGEMLIALKCDVK